MSAAHKKQRTGVSDIPMLKKGRGPNSQINKAGKFMHAVKTDDRTHVVTPGDYQICACCNEPSLNICQHQAFQCPLSVHHNRLLDKFREAHLHLLQRHHENPTKWKHPGPFHMLKAEMVAAFEDKLPVKVMDNQDDTWNILLKIKRQQFFGNGAAVHEGHVGEVLVSIGEQVKVNSPSACLWVLEQHDDQQADERRRQQRRGRRAQVRQEGQRQRQQQQGRLARAQVRAAHGEEQAYVRSYPGSPTSTSQLHSQQLMKSEALYEQIALSGYRTKDLTQAISNAP